MQYMDFTRPGVEVWSWTFLQQTKGGPGINNWAAHGKRAWKCSCVSKNFPQPSKTEINPWIIKPFPPWLLFAEAPAQLCPGLFSGTCKKVEMLPPTFAWQMWLKEEQAQLLHTAAKAWEHWRFGIPNLTEKIQLKLTAHTVKDIRGDILAMSSAFGSGEEKNK